MKLNLKSNWKTQHLLAVMVLLGLSTLIVQCQESGTTEEGEQLEQGFLNPPEAAKPRVWWHWMGGDVSWEGAKADMDWMKAIGIGGLQCLHAGGRGRGPETASVENYSRDMSEGWKAAFAKSAH